MPPILMNSIVVSARTWWWLYAAAALSLATTLNAPYTGEEAVYTITSLEMRLNGDPVLTTLLGNGYGRPPLYNWLVIPLAEMLGWDNVLLATRLVTLLATALTGLVLAWLTMQLTMNRSLAAFAAAVFLSGDVLFYRGWLAYADPLLTFFVFSAIACLWVGVLRRESRWLWLAAPLVFCGFLAKVQTAYLFYAIAFAVLAWRRESRQFLFGFRSLVAQVFAIGLLLTWNMVFAQGAHGGGTAADIVLKIKTMEWGPYIAQVLTFPPEMVVRMLPISAVALYAAWRMRGSAGGAAALEGFPWAPLSAMLVINFLPYWWGPNTHVRYVMPLYPLAALLISAVIWRCGERPLRLALGWLTAAVAVKYVLGLWLFPWYQHKFRGDYAATAAQITALTREHPLYATDVSATGLSVTAHLDTKRFPQPYLRWPPQQWEHGFVLSYAPNAELGQTAASFKLGSNTLYLLCRGTACDAVSMRKQ